MGNEGMSAALTVVPADDGLMMYRSGGKGIEFCLVNNPNYKNDAWAALGHDVTLEFKK